jgi:hypothetical protein
MPKSGIFFLKKMIFKLLHFFIVCVLWLRLLDMVLNRGIGTCKIQACWLSKPRKFYIFLLLYENHGNLSVQRNSNKLKKL